MNTKTRKGLIIAVGILGGLILLAALAFLALYLYVALSFGGYSPIYEGVYVSKPSSADGGSFVRLTFTPIDKSAFDLADGVNVVADVSKKGRT